MLLQEARKAKVETNPAVKANLQAARNQVLVNAVLQDWVKKNPVPEADLKNTRSVTSS